MLKDSLCGNCKTVCLSCVSSSDLQFYDRKHAAVNEQDKEHKDEREEEHVQCQGADLAIPEDERGAQGAGTGAAST